MVQFKEACSRVVKLAASLWDIIGDNRISMHTENDVESAIERVRLRLQDLDPVELSQFQDELHARLFERTAKSSPRSRSCLGTEHSCRKLATDSCTHGPRAYSLESTPSKLQHHHSQTFVRFVEPFANAAESLLYLAPNEYLRKTGEDMGSRSPSYESGSNMTYWSS